MTRRLTGIPRARLATHGDFDKSANISQRIKEALDLDDAFMNASHREALQMIAFKMARIRCGDPDHLDHWRDIAGYAHLGERACEGKGRKG